MGQIPPPLSSVDDSSFTHPAGAISTASSKHDLELLESTSLLLRIILSSPDDDPDINNASSTKPPASLRNLSLTTAIQSLSTYDVLHELQVLDEYRRRSATNLYQRVRALFFLYAIHRFHLPGRRMLIEKMLKKRKNGNDDIPHDDMAVQSSKREEAKTVFCPKGYAALLDRRFEESIDYFLASVPTSPSTIPISPTDESNYTQNKAQDVNNNVAPRRTSLKSNLTFSRQSSSATTISEEDDEMVYSANSNISVLAGEKLLSSAISELTISNSNISLLLMPSDATSSALAKGYKELAFQTLANQVKSSVKSHPGNEWMFTMVNIKDQPLRFSNKLLILDEITKSCPILLEKTPVRMDLSHSCWSDIFFLGMDFPEAAKVINCSVDLSVQTSDGSDNVLPSPPIECKLQLTTANPGTIRLTSVDLKTTVLLTHVSEVFNYGADYLGLLKAGIVACGIVPLGLEDKCEDMLIKDLLCAMIPTETSECECPYGLELTTNVHNIPKGSRLAVSTNLLGSIIAVSMRATQQTQSLTGPLLESERRLVAARAILGEWLGGSGGGWQDSGGVWPGLKLIHGVKAKEGDPEFGISRGCLLPQHRLLNKEEAPESLLHALEQSLVLVHGGMAQNVGPILEMVTEKYLLREEEEWHARNRALEILDDLLIAFKQSDIKTIAQLVTENFFGPIRSVIPSATNVYTEKLISRVQERFGERFWGFWMLGGMSGGGMGFIFDPSAKKEALVELECILLQTKEDMSSSLAFAMDPVVFDYRVNEQGTIAELCPGSSEDGDENDTSTTDDQTSTTHDQNLNDLLIEQGFDMKIQNQIRSDLQNGVIGLAKNKLSPETELTDVLPEDVIVVSEDIISQDTYQLGLKALEEGSVGVVTLAAGVGSRWTSGAGVVKALNPFCCLGGKHRSFVDIHLAKNRRVSSNVGTSIPHVLTTSWMTDEAISSYIESLPEDSNTPIYISKGQSIGLRMIPMVCDLEFLWKEQSHQRLDEQAEKVRDSIHTALMGWAESNGEGSDYTDNSPKQCLSPIGHWYEVPNLILNGTLAKMLRDRPQLKTLMLHNIDTIGADVDAGVLGKFLESSSTLAFEVVPRCIDDMGGGLCRVDGKPRLVEGLALPREEDELKFSYYNSLTTWIHIDKLLSTFGLDRKDILDQSPKVQESINTFSRRLPTYVTIKDVKKRWGNGQEDVYPVAQYEKLWGDMSSIEGVDCSYFVVSRQRGQQLKEPAQIDGWSRDGSASYLDSLCKW